MSNGPLPSVLCSISDLPRRSVGDKVRFLGWYATPYPPCFASCFLRIWLLTDRSITSYEFSTASLMLESKASGDGSTVAAVDVKLRLESMSPEQTEPGYWLNIVGYITSIAPLSPGTTPDGSPGHRVGIQCILHWPATSVDPVMYERYMELQTASTNDNLPGS